MSHRVICVLLCSVELASAQSVSTRDPLVLLNAVKDYETQFHGTRVGLTLVGYPIRDSDPRSTTDGSDIPPDAPAMSNTLTFACAISEDGLFQRLFLRIDLKSAGGSTSNMDLGISRNEICAIPGQRIEARQMTPREDNVENNLIVLYI